MERDSLRAVLGLAAIDGVALTDIAPEAPYGTGPARVPANVLELCRELGIRTEEHDGGAAWAEIGQRDERILPEDLLAAEEIYRRVMEKLANLKG